MYDAIVSLIILKIIDAIIGLRVTDEVEREGLDSRCTARRAVKPDRKVIPVFGQVTVESASGRGGNPALSLPFEAPVRKTGGLSFFCARSYRPMLLRQYGA